MSDLLCPSCHHPARVYGGKLLHICNGEGIRNIASDQPCRSRIDGHKWAQHHQHCDIQDCMCVLMYRSKLQKKERVRSKKIEKRSVKI